MRKLLKGQFDFNVCIYVLIKYNFFTSKHFYLFLFIFIYFFMKNQIHKYIFMNIYLFLIFFYYVNTVYKKINIII